MAALNKGSPAEWLNVSQTGLLYNCVFGALKDTAEQVALAGTDVVPLLLSSGYLEACVKAMETFEAEGGPSADTNVMSFFFGVLWNLAALDFSRSPEALAMLRGAAGPLRYAMEHDMPQLATLGLTCRTFACILAANLFGKDEEDEGGLLQLGQDSMEPIIRHFQENIQPRIYGSMFPLSSGFQVLNLTISDYHKTQLLQVSNFIPHIIAGLMLDMEIRPDTELGIRACTQRNYAEVFQQLALFEPGRKALIAEEKIVRAALEAVVSGDSWHDDEARKCAESTLSLLFPSARPTDREKLHRESVDPGTRHIMMSCECN